MKKIVLIGAGGFGREVAVSIIKAINLERSRYELVGFLDDGEQWHDGMTIEGYPWLGRHNWIIDYKDKIACVCTIGNAKIKETIQRELMKQGVRFETLIAPGVFIADDVEIGPGCVIYGGVTISINSQIGAGVLLNYGVRIGHDVTIGDYTSIMTDTCVSGKCAIGRSVDIGGHAYIIPGKKIGDGAKVAAGSIVFTNVKAGVTVLGNPAKRMKALE